MSARSEKRLIWLLIFVLGAIIAILPLLSGKSVFYFLDVPTGLAVCLLAWRNIRRLRRRYTQVSLTED
jgi:hypothetical protein